MTNPDLADGPGSDPDTREERADLERLGDELGPLGCKTILVARDGRAPFLDVLHPAHPWAGASRVRAQADYFWWPTGQVIADRTRITAAARAIARTLGVPDGLS